MFAFLNPFNYKKLSIKCREPDELKVDLDMTYNVIDTKYAINIVKKESYNIELNGINYKKTFDYFNNNVDHKLYMQKNEEIENIINLFKNEFIHHLNYNEKEIYKFMNDSEINEAIIRSINSQINTLGPFYSYNILVKMELKNYLDHTKFVTFKIDHKIKNEIKYDMIDPNKTYKLEIIPFFTIMKSYDYKNKIIMNIKIRNIEESDTSLSSKKLLSQNSKNFDETILI